MGLVVVNGYFEDRDVKAISKLVAMKHDSDSYNYRTYSPLSTKSLDPLSCSDSHPCARIGDLRMRIRKKAFRVSGATVDNQKSWILLPIQTPLTRNDPMSSRLTLNPKP